MILCREIEVLPQSPSRVTPPEKDGRRSEKRKGSGKRRTYDLVTFILIIHNGNVNKVEQYVRKIDGVESVKGDSMSNKLKVKGKVDPSEIQKMVERNTKTRVKLSFPSAEIEGYEDETEGPEEKLKVEKTRPDDIASKKSEESVMVLKIKLCCNDCNGKLRQKLKVQGLEMVTMDKEKDLVTVKGTVNVTELTSYIKGEFKRDVEVVVPAKKDTVSTKNNVRRDTGAVDKKVKDAGALDKKGNEVGTAEMIMREKETKSTNKKSKGEGEGKGKDGGAMDTKGNEVRARKIRDKHSEPRGSASVENKSGKKYSSVNQKKDKHGGRGKNEEASSDGSSRGNYQEEGIATKVNPPHFYRSDDDFHSRTANYSNGFQDMFSDENPHSYCTIL